jgi:hypothetical protein
MSEVMGFFTKNPAVSADFMAKYGNNANTLRESMKSYETGQGIFSTFFKDSDGSGKVDAADITSNLANAFGLDASQLAALDFDDYGIDLPDFIDSNNDGKVDSATNIADRMGAMGVEGKVGLASQGLPTSFATDIKGAIGSLSQAKTEMQAISKAPANSVVHKIESLSIPSGSTNYSDFNKALNASSEFLKYAQKERDGIASEISRLTADMSNKAPAAKIEYQKAIDALKARETVIAGSIALAATTRDRVMKANQAIAKLPPVPTKKDDLRKLAKTNPQALAAEMAAHLRERAIAKVGPQPNAKVGSKTYNGWLYKIQQAEKKIKSPDFERAFQEQFGARAAQLDHDNRQAAILRDTDAYLKAERARYKLGWGGGTGGRNSASEKGPEVSREGQRSPFERTFDAPSDMEA